MDMHQNLPSAQYSPSAQKPGKVLAIAIMTLVSGIINILYGIILTIFVIIGTFGIGLLCVPVTFAPTILGIWEVVAASKLLNNHPRQVKVQGLAISEIMAILSLNFITTIIGILNLVFYNDPDIKAYMRSLPR